MQYEKPAVLKVENALRSIKGDDKGMEAPDNNGGSQLATANASPIDE